VRLYRRGGVIESMPEPALVDFYGDGFYGDGHLVRDANTQRVSAANHATDDRC
jgi:hypothetical protein